jgi:hypothetical protein
MIIIGIIGLFTIRRSWRSIDPTMSDTPREMSRTAGE